MARAATGTATRRRKKLALALEPSINYLVSKGVTAEQAGSKLAILVRVEVLTKKQGGLRDRTGCDLSPAGTGRHDEHTGHRSDSAPHLADSRRWHRARDQQATLAMLEAAGAKLRWEEVPAGVAALPTHHDPLPEITLALDRKDQGRAQRDRCRRQGHRLSLGQRRAAAAL